MKKYLCLLFPILLFTGCLDIVEYVYIDGDDFEIDLRYALQKSILEMASSFGGDSIDYSDFQIMADNFIEPFSGLAMSVDKINTSLECGSRVKISGKYSALSDMMGSNANFFPILEKDRISITLPSLGSDDDETAAFLSSSKFRIIVEKTKTVKEIMKFELIQGSNLISSENLKDALPFLEYRGFYIIEIPLIFLTENTVINIYIQDNSIKKITDYF